MGRKQIAKDAAVTASPDGLEDFLQFCPGAGKVEALTPPDPAPVMKPLAQDSVLYTWNFNPLTNCLEQVPVRRDAFKR